MTSRCRFLAVAFLVTATVSASAQSRDDSRRDDRHSDPTAREADRLRRLVERIARPAETERDKVKEEIGEAVPDVVLPDDAEQWFEVVAGREKVWDRRTITDGGLRDVFDRVVTRLKLTGGQVARSDFRAYAREYLSAERSPAWREPRERDMGREADRIFQRLDQNRDRWLTATEQPDSLRTNLSKWDADGDRFINSTEYRAYFPDRLRQATREWQARPATPADTNTTRGERPPAGRAAEAPKGTPTWFAELDTDSDGQVGLYEWRQVWPVREFVQIDPNRDGFLTAAELRRLLETTGPDRPALADDLARRQLRSSAGR
jgi:hypothetical protein